MIQAIFRRAEATVDHAVGSLLARVLVAIPFLVAAGFATAAGAYYITSAYGPQAGNLVMAVTFAVIGLIVWAIVASRPAPSLLEDAHDATIKDEARKAAQPADPVLAQADREMMMAALTSLGPLALPTIGRLVAKNLPLIAAIGAAAFILTQPGEDGGAPTVDPAE
ncbi:MAG: hypothetical protein R3D67_17445 [Hyphomicrobiaceae bacterium]